MSGAKPVDLLELAREVGAAEARERALQSRRDSVQLIMFERSRDHGRDLPVGRHPQTNRIVFPDMKRFGGRIKSGEAYFCDLVEYQPAAGPSVYYANPLTKIDASYLFDLQSDHVDKLVDALLRSAQAQLLEQARARIQSTLEQDGKSRLASLTSERDSLRAENLALHSELAGSRQLPKAVGQQGAATHAEQSISPSSPPPRRSLESLPRSEQNPQSLPRPSPPDASPCSRITRPAPDELQSALLPEGRYFVHVSPDRQRLFIHRHPDGNLPAGPSSLKIPGLSVLRPFDGEEELLAIPNSRVGGIAVDLSQGGFRPEESSKSD